MRAVSRRLGVPLSTVQHWVKLAEGQRLDRVQWQDHASVPHAPCRTSAKIEKRVVRTRQQLRNHSTLGEYGAVAIHRDLASQGITPLPSVRTIGRILLRNGLLDGRVRTRRPAPPKGWYLPCVAQRNGELDAFDTIEGLAIQGGPHLCILTGVSLHGGLAGAWPQRSVSAKSVVASLIEHWQVFGLPAYAQFDNDNRFTGPRQHPDAIGRVIRICLSLDIIPIFAPPKETGFQASIESFNGRWQAKVWNRFQHLRLRDLVQRSRRYIEACHKRHAPRIDAAPSRLPFPENWTLNLQTPPQGTVIFLRRTDGTGHTEILGHRHFVDSHWTHRLIRAELHIERQLIQFYALRRRAPQDQPVLNTAHYELPNKRFKD